ncbi:hypothetical protein F0562_011780 [Nyssa sinensis]|uniref:DFDF domain-containing protein n=1 Tax=Nyssa sinensis TaxID=561372 RepID=A0A5J4ZQT9_9ASTE|nr:hypothetical protein F0562_011780 [Nyssa sinensis]
MMNESSKKVSSSSPSPSSSSSVDSYIGSFISLTSKYDIRYEGVLYYLNPQDSTLGLKNVRSHGTEGRKKDGPQIPPSDKVYDYILFRGSDIKDLQVNSSPTAQTEELVLNDPAIIQSHCTVGPSSSSKSASIGVGSFTDFSSYQESPALTNRTYPGKLPSHQSGSQVGSWGYLQTNQNADVTSFSVPMYWLGYNGTSNSIPSAAQHPIPFVTTSAATSLPQTVLNLLRAPANQELTTMALGNSSDGVTPVSSLTTSISVHSNLTPTLTPLQHSNSPTEMPSSLSVKESLQSHPTLLTVNRLTMSSFPSSSQDMKTIEAPIVGKAGSDPLHAFPVQSLRSSASLIADSTSSPLLKLSPTLLTPDQLAQSRPSLFSPTHRPYPDQKDMVTLNSASPNSSSSITTPAVQAPLLPLPLLAQQSQYSMPQFTEEFDFEAMNEKFKKDEVWGYLGNAKQRDKTQSMERNAAGQHSGDEGGYVSVPKFDPKPAYNKDEFFDTISSNSLARGARNGQSRFSERLKLDTETFGTFQQRPHLGYGGYGAGYGENYRGSYNRGRGYYGGRGRGGIWRI